MAGSGLWVVHCTSLANLHVVSVSARRARRTSSGQSGRARQLHASPLLSSSHLFSSLLISSLSPLFARLINRSAIDTYPLFDYERNRYDPTISNISILHGQHLDGYQFWYSM